jgi:hypothetical protein
MSTSSVELNTTLSDSLTYRRSRSRLNKDLIEIAVVFPWAVAGAFLGTLVCGVGSACSDAWLHAASEVGYARDSLRNDSIYARRRIRAVPMRSVVAETPPKQV